ncbi:hypothetical protein C8D83_101961 [Halothiobacillus neapolitanus]|nr:hypothetical protein C8D83_101961 [Halothiobacillus neapolitanus]
MAFLSKVMGEQRTCSRQARTQARYQAQHTCFGGRIRKATVHNRARVDMVAHLKIRVLCRDVRQQV